MGDVLVIGGGMAGCLAALHLASGGARVVLSRGGWGATATCNGGLDLAVSAAFSSLDAQAPHAGSTQASLVAQWTLRQHLSDIISHSPLHPYTTLGLEGTLAHMAAGFAQLQAALAPSQLGASPWDAEVDSVHLVPCGNGTLSPVGATLGPQGYVPPRPWAAQAKGSPTPAGRWGVLNLAAPGMHLGPRTQAGWLYDAKQFAAPEVNLTQVLLQDSPQSHASPFALARALDDPDACAAWCAAVGAKLAGLDGVFVPPVMGLRRHAQVMASAAAAWQMPVAEALSMLPSVPGVRLIEALEAACVAAGVRLVSQIESVQCQGASFVSATTQSHGDVHAGSCVLATGRFMTGGLSWERGSRCREPLFNLPAMTALGPLVERDALELTRRRPEEPQPLLTAGVGTDGHLRPLMHNGQPLQNVYAAGLVLGGYGNRFARCADGVAMASAHFVAEQILGAAPPALPTPAPAAEHAC